MRLTLLSFCTSDSSFAISHDYSVHPWTGTTCHSIVFCMLQIAAGTSFPQKTKQNRHGDIKFLDELAHNNSEFVQVTCRLSQPFSAIVILVDCPWQAVLQPTSGAITAASAEETEQLLHHSQHNLHLGTLSCASPMHSMMFSWCCSSTV